MDLQVCEEFIRRYANETVKVTVDKPRRQFRLVVYDFDRPGTEFVGET
ncbi:MAG: hypothetical protein IKJ37_15500 [Kiritimatiellae bacterium]|nr:hypothetical protein [Kiritimatiellia bacterium]